MKTMCFVLVRLAVLFLAGCLVSGVRAASVGAGGYTEPPAGT